MVWKLESITRIEIIRRTLLIGYPRCVFHSGNCLAVQPAACYPTLLVDVRLRVLSNTSDCGTGVVADSFYEAQLPLLDNRYWTSKTLVNPAYLTWTNLTVRLDITHITRCNAWQRQGLGVCIDVCRHSFHHPSSRAGVLLVRVELWTALSSVAFIHPPLHLSTSQPVDPLSCTHTMVIHSFGHLSSIY